MNKINHPKHYGGAENPHEPIKIIEHYSLGFHLGNAIKYILRAGRKGDIIEDLKKAVWYLNRKIEQEEEAEKQAKEFLEKQNEITPKAS